MNTKNKYPVVFVHGMLGWGEAVGLNKISPYWGASSGDLVRYLNGRGYSCCAATVGPVSSAWDNACELYAQLIGARVDYGKAHSEAYNHERFGRRYKKPLVENFQKGKIHLVGHSHGGQVIRMLVHLLAFGDEAERAVTDEKTISPLFRGGNESLIASVVTLCTPNNGTTLYRIAEEADIIKKICRCIDYTMGIAGRTPIHGRFIDCQLEQFGLTPVRGEKKADKLSDAVKRISSVNDHVLTDLSLEGAYALNQKIEASESTNYFCYAACATDEKNHLPECARLRIIRPLCKLMGTHKLPENCCGIEFDDSWHRNDGLVNTVSANNPFDEPAKIYDGKVEGGVWNIMPEFKGEHGRITGLKGKKSEVHPFFENLLDMLVSLE